MRKQDFWKLIGCDIGTLGLIIEHLCGLEMALPTLCVWTIISCIIHIVVLKDYAITRG